MNEQIKNFHQSEQRPFFTSFEWNNKSQLIKFVETEKVAKGVECDVYSFIDDLTKDLGIIRIQPGHKTPLQRVLVGEKTIEGYISGKGKLVIKRVGGKEEIYEVGGKSESKLEVTVNVGDSMQWQAAAESYLTAYEICFPPYKEGRYEETRESDPK